MTSILSNYFQNRTPIKAPDSFLGFLLLKNSTNYIKQQQLRQIQSNYLNIPWNGSVASVDDKYKSLD